MFIETLRQALSAILRNAMRSFLTVLGVIIGVAAVIALVTIGRGSTAQIERDVSSLGVNLLMMRPGQGMGPGSTSSSSKPFTLKDVTAIAAEVPGVLAAAPVNSTTQTIIAGNENHATPVTGTTNGYLAARDWKLAEGRSFLEAEERAGSAVCVVGKTVREELFGAGSPVGEKIRIGQVSCRVIGLLEEKGASTFGQDQDNIVLMPIRGFMRRIGGTQDVTSINIGADPAFSTVEVKATIEVLMRERRRILPGEEDNFSVLDTKELTSMMTGITTVMTGLLSSVAAVSLLVGGIGIMNIMLVSVTERTREIGIRLAIGATEGQVLLQFLVEAIVLSLLGGLIGIVLGLALAWGGGRLLNVPFTPSFSVILLAFGFSAFIGVVFGYFPARRAARLDPIEALHHE